MDFDTAIIGSGPAGLFTALSLVDRNYKGNIAIFEQGKIRSISDLQIPALVEVGFGGAGAAADGKLNLSGGQGGNLETLIGEELLNSSLAELVLQKYTSFGGESGYRTKTRVGNELILKAEQEGMRLIPSDIMHFGTDVCKTIIENMYYHLSDKTSIFLRTKIKSIECKGNGFALITAEGERHYADNVVLAVGREQNWWAADQCRNMGIKIESNGADLGLRAEAENDVLEKLANEFYEAKIKCHTLDGYDVRTFCMCPSGFVINDNGKVNGHSYRYRKSDNTNVALLVTLNGIKEPDKYLREWLSKPMERYGKPIIVEMYGDFKNGAGNPKLPSNNKVKPTLAEEYWVAGNIHKVLPSEVCGAIGEFIEKIKVIAPRFNADSTLLYGNEGKNYALRVSLNVDNSDPKMPGLRTSVPGFYIGGDGSGWTRGLFQSSAMGLLIGYDIARRAA